MSESPQQMNEPVLPGEAGPRVVAAIGRRVAPESAVVVRAARQFRRRPALLLAVTALATVSFLSEMAAQQAALRRYYPDLARARRASAPHPNTFAMRWAQTYRHGGTLYPVVLSPLTRFAWPLERAEAPANGLMRAIWWRLNPPRPIERTQPWRDGGTAMLFVVPSVAASTMFLVVLLGWVRDSDRRLRLADVPRALRAHYLPVFAVTLIPALWQTAMLPLASVWPYFPFSYELPVTEGNFLSEVAYGALEVTATVMQWLVFHGPLTAVMLAPFVIVGRNVGAKTGIIEGLRLLGRRWLTLIVLLLGYRVGYEALTVWKALSPWATGGRSVVNLTMPGPVAWLWVGDVGLALLGLWVAYAFMEIARRPEATA